MESGDKLEPLFKNPNPNPIPKSSLSQTPLVSLLSSPMANKKRKTESTKEEPQPQSQPIQEEKKKKLIKKSDKTPISNPTNSSSETLESKSETIQKLLEPYSKDQLIDLLCDASLKDSSLVERIQSIADQDVSHRKIFVHGLSWDTTQQTFEEVFRPFGDIEEIKLVVDKLTGKAKGYGFVMYKTRAFASKALEQSQKKIGNRIVSCQLASIGPGQQQQQPGDNSARKIYVSNVHPDIDKEKLRNMFAKFGEIESGPMGFDLNTGRSRGFALFVYKTIEGAKKALEEPYKMFDGHQLHCQLASCKPATQQVQQQQQAVQPAALAAAAAAQNLAIFSQHPSLNPAFNGLLMNSYPGLVGAAGNPLFQGGIPPTQIGASPSVTSVGLQYGASPSYGMGLLGDASSRVGIHSSPMPSLQEVQAYQNSQQYLGQGSSSRTNSYLSYLAGRPYLG